MTKERRLRSLRINGRPVKVVSNQIIVDHFDETKYQVAGYTIEHSEWQEVTEDKFLN